MSKPYTHEDYVAGYEYFRNLSQEKDTRITELETDKENLRLYASGLENAQNLITVRFRNLQTEMQEVANQLMDLYDKCIETTEPEVFGTILGLHERLETALK